MATQEQMPLDDHARSQLRPRKRQSRGRSRGGCRQCKSYHIKCDETKPRCSRCRTGGYDCLYVGKWSRKNKSRDWSQQPKASERILLPARSAPPVTVAKRLLPSATSRTIEPSAVLTKIDPADVVYFDYFRQVISQEMGRQTDSPSDFWTRSVLRQTAGDQSTLDAAIALGAIHMAKRTSSTALPLVKMGCHGSGSSPTTAPVSPHYLRALRYHARALAAFRGYAVAIHQGGSRRAPRALLMIALMANRFELQHGNMRAVDMLSAHCISALLKSVISRSKSSSSDSEQQQQHLSVAAAAVDDGGVADAELFLIRRIVMSCGPSPMMATTRESIIRVGTPLILGPRPPDTTHSIHDYGRAWWRFFSLATAWHFSASATMDAQPDGPCAPRLRDEQAQLVARISDWEAQAVLHREAAADRGDRLVLSLYVLEARVLHLCTACAFDASPTGETWRARHAEWQAIKYLYLAIATPQSPQASSRELSTEQVIFGLMQVARECRDGRMRREALELCRAGLRPKNNTNLETMVMGTSAVVWAEEEDGEEGRWVWTGTGWNGGHTELLVTLTSRLSLGAGAPRRKTVVVKRLIT